MRCTHAHRCTPEHMLHTADKTGGGGAELFMDGYLLLDGLKEGSALELRLIGLGARALISLSSVLQRGGGRGGVRLEL
jgi:hypothetical protein